MYWICTLYAVLLFFLLTPGVLLRLPPNGNTLTVAATHAVVFGIVWYLTTKVMMMFFIPHMIMPNI